MLDSIVSSTGSDAVIKPMVRSKHVHTSISVYSQVTSRCMTMRIWRSKPPITVMPPTAQKMKRRVFFARLIRIFHKISIGADNKTEFCATWMPLKTRACVTISRQCGGVFGKPRARCDHCAAGGSQVNTVQNRASSKYTSTVAMKTSQNHLHLLEAPLANRLMNRAIESLINPTA